MRVVLEDLTPIAWEASTLHLRSAVGTQLAAESLRGEIIALANTAAALPKTQPALEVQITPEQPAHAASDAGPTPSEAVAQHPLIQQTITLLGARVVGVQPRKPST